MLANTYKMKNVFVHFKSIFFSIFAENRKQLKLYRRDM